MKTSISYPAFMVIIFSVILLFGCRADDVSTDDMFKEREIITERLSNTVNIDSLKALIESKDISSPELIAVSWRLSDLYAAHSDLDNAVRYQFMGFDEAKRVNDTLSYIYACNNLGIFYRRKSNFQNAAKYHTIGIHSGEAFSDSLRYEVRKANMLNVNGLGKVYMNVGYIEEAKKEFLYGLTLGDSSTLGNKALNYANIGIIYIKEGNYDSARWYIYESYKYDIIKGDSVGLALSYIHLGSLCKMKGHKQEAMDYYNASMNYFKERGDDWHWLEGAAAMAEFHMENSNYYKAYPLLMEILEKAQRLKTDKYLNFAHTQLHDYYHHLGNYREALKHSELMGQYYQKLMDAQQLGGVKDITAEYDRSMQQDKIDDLSHKNSLLTIQRRNTTIILLSIIIAIFLIWGIFMSFISKRLKTMNTKVRQSEEMKKSFINSMCHEIRTPLHQISGFSQVLASSSDELSTEEKGQYGEIIAQNTEELTQILDQILEISDLDSSQDYLPMEEVSVVDCIRNASDCQIHNNHNKNVELVIKNLHEGDETVTTNANYLTTQLKAILDNAFKFTSEGVITVTFKSENGHKLISVADTGIGIPVTLQEKVFEKFYKIDSFEKGTGLGLYLTRIIAVRLHNKVYINKNYTCGTDVIIEF